MTSRRRCSSSSRFTWAQYSAIGEIQRHRCHRQDFPHPVVDHLDDSHREAGPDEVARTPPEKTLRPRSIDRLSREERHDDFRRSALDQAIRDNSSRDRHSLPRPHEVAHRAAERPVCKPAACIATMTVAAFTSIRRNGCERCGSASPCVTVPAAATSIVASGPSSSSEVNSMTKDGGMVAQSFVAACCIARAEVRIAARIRPENSRVRSGCGQSANPRSTPAPIAISRKHDDRGKPRTRPHSGNFGEEFEKSIHRGL